MLNAGEATVDAYVRPLVDLDGAAVTAAIDRFVRGAVPGQRIGWPPDQTEFYLEAQKQHSLLQRQNRAPISREVPEGCKMLPDGTIVVPVGVPFDWDNTVIPDGDVVDYGYGSIRLGGLTRREASVIDRLGGMTPDGKNFARLSIEEKRAEIARYLPAPVAA